MKVILQEDVASLGKTGDVVSVSNGYGRNFLLPRNLAMLADEANTNRVEHQKRVAAARQAKVLAAAKEFAERLSRAAVTLRRNVGAEDKLFGSVTNADIAEALAAQGIEVDKRQVQLDEPLRTIGAHTVAVRVHPGIDASVKVFVMAEKAR